MKISVLPAFFAAAASFAFAQTPATQSGAPKVFVDAGHGFNLYLTAAIAAKHVPLDVVTDKSMAEYSLEAVSGSENSESERSPVLPGLRGASMRLVNLRTSEGVCAFSVGRSNLWRGTKGMAEDCAQHVKAALQDKAGTPAESSFPVKAARALGLLPSHDPTFAF
jgi:hypothetical protein